MVTGTDSAEQTLDTALISASQEMPASNTLCISVAVSCYCACGRGVRCGRCGSLRCNTVGLHVASDAGHAYGVDHKHASTDGRRSDGPRRAIHHDQPSLRTAISRSLSHGASLISATTLYTGCTLHVSRFFHVGSGTARTARCVAAPCTLQCHVRPVASRKDSLKLLR